MTGRQTAGRGRLGRTWTSQQGNLFASVLLRPECPIQTRVHLAFVAGCAAHDALMALAPALGEGLRLKWPNDVLLEGRKLGGILLESMAQGPDSGAAVVIGTGINLTNHPADTPLAATDVAAAGIAISTAEAFHRLAASTAQWLDVWAEGAGWQKVRSAWQDRALPVGTPISVKSGERVHEGRYGGIDADGGLLLNGNDGRCSTVTAGDVFLL